MRTRQRLIVCLDGTWNNQDDSTNVLQHFALALNGAPAGDSDIVQNKHYIAGVGTGMLDRISGGGFAFGLEENVRAAYDWLVENYHDDGGSASADEIYIFGFSRGAYTARSLVGFISICGLLRRGAPLSVNQLWNDYCVLGRQRENRTSIWDRFFDDPPTTVRRISDLICDPWNVAWFEKRRQKTRGAAAGNGHRPAGQLVDDLNTTERLLIRWSRRARITYLGVYDTVGAVGIDALAIPGLKSRLAMHHNMRPTKLVQNCRHALALDEHRSSFKHTALMQYLWHGSTEDDNQNAEMAAEEREGDDRGREKDRAHWERESADWRRRIEQRWFVGAHSNVGGGYPDNELAQRPLAWLLEGACKAGLVCEPFEYVAPVVPPEPRDSYAEFAKPLWTHVIRGKRFYRPIDPDPEPRASRPKPGEQNGRQPAGFSLLSINEHVDQSVLDRASQLPDYRPPNLVEYARRKYDAVGLDSAVDVRVLKALGAEAPSHTWLGQTARPYLILVLWATCAALGLLPMIELFAPGIDLSPTWSIGFGVGIVALFFVLVDWSESRTNFSLAIQPSDARWRALFDSVYWSRTIGVLLFFMGAIAATATLLAIGWNGDGEALLEAARWTPVPVLAAVGVLLANALDRSPRARTRAGVTGAGEGLVAAAVSAVVLVGLGWLFQRLITPAFGRHAAQLVSPASDAHAAGLFLLLQDAIVYFAIAFRWVGEPMATANLGTILPLQMCRTPAEVMQVLERWREMLANRWSGADRDVRGPAGQAMRDVVRQALWRDIFGFIPVYLLALGFAAWYVVQEVGHEPMAGWIGAVHIGSLQVGVWVLAVVPFIVWLPIVAAVADYVEDICHLRYLAHHETGRPIAAWLTIASFTSTLIKFVGFAPLVFVVVPAGLALGAIDLAWLGDTTGWRGTVALLVIALVLAAAIALVFEKVRMSREPKRTNARGSVQM